MTEEDKWTKGIYPYDIATCGACITRHAEGQCNLPEHREFSRVAAEVLGDQTRAYRRQDPEAVRKFTNLRELFRDFYPQNQHPETAPEEAEVNAERT
jgi:hypothetical protein